MAGFADLVRTFVAMADTMTETLQGNVTHYAYASATKDDSGKIVWGTGEVRLALIENVNQLVRNQQGKMVMATTKVTFLRPVVIDPRDKILLPNGKQCQIVRIGEFVDPENYGKGYLVEVWLG